MLNGGAGYDVLQLKMDGQRNALEPHGVFDKLRDSRTLKNVEELHLDLSGGSANALRSGLPQKIMTDALSGYRTLRITGDSGVDNVNTDWLENTWWNKVEIDDYTEWSKDDIYGNTYTILIQSGL